MMVAAAPLPPGDWGGDGVMLRVTADGAVLSADCASGVIRGALSPDGDGRFSAGGLHVRDAPGPAPGDQQLRDNARFSGRIADGWMTLTVREAGGAATEYRMQAGRRVKLHRCG